MSIVTSTKRVLRYGLIGFIRNGFVSFSAILIMSVTLFVIADVMISTAALKATLQELTEQVDITVYFRTDAPLESITQLQTSLQTLTEVAKVEFVSREKALDEFRNKHKDNQLTMQALDELGDNPLGASLEVSAKETSHYESIANFLEAQQKAGGPGSAIDKINFNQNKTAIDKLTHVIQTSEQNGMAQAIVLAFCSIFIAFITIRLAIYTARDEINVMTIVGAARSYVQGPFLIAGVLYGFISATIVLAALYAILLLHPILLGLGPVPEILIGNFSPFAYYVEHFFEFFLLLNAVGITLGVISSFVAVRRYLKV